MNPLVFKKNVGILARWLKHDFPRIVGVEGVNHFKLSFDNEGFTDKSLQKWPDVKRRTEAPPELIATRGKNKGKLKTSAPAWRRKKILTQTGDLSESIRFDNDYNSVTFQTDIKYAQAHNEGTENAGRGGKTKLPQRQFMGPSAVLNTTLRKDLEDKVKSFFKR